MKHGFLSQNILFLSSDSEQGRNKIFDLYTKDLFHRIQFLLRITELLFPKMPNFTANEKFLENFVLIFSKDNTECFLFCN